MTEVNWFTVASGVVGGVALLMYGIRIMGEGLESAAGDALRKILAALTRNAWLACVVGTVVTAIVQSSSAVTVMTVGFVNAQLMTFRQALGVIYGANIGTTVTGQIMAFQITQVALPAIALGFALQFFSKRRVLRNLGQGILGFGMLFLGLMLLRESVHGLRESAAAVQLLTTLSHNLLLSVLAGMIVTICLQSSSASLGIVMVLTAQDLITLPAAIAMMLGDNIGTCITAQVASLGTQPTARRAAWAHTLHNVIGVALALLLLRWFLPAVLWMSPGTEGVAAGTAEYEAALQRQVANSHTLFNVLNALLFLVFNSWFALLLERWMPDRRDRMEEVAHIDRRLLDTPAAAAGAALQEMAHMARLCRRLVRGATRAVLHPDTTSTKELWVQDDAIDELQDAITDYLVELVDRDIPDYVAAQIPGMLHVVNDLERIGDHCKNLLELAEQRAEESMPWSEAAEASVTEMGELVESMLDYAIQGLGGEDREAPRRILELEKTVDHLTMEGRNAHLERARSGECLMLPGVLFLDALMNYEKIGDHVRNIGRALGGGLLEAGTRLPSTRQEINDQ